MINRRRTTAVRAIARTATIYGNLQPRARSEAKATAGEGFRAFAPVALIVGAVLVSIPTASIAQAPVNPRFRLQQPIAVQIGPDVRFVGPNLQSYTLADVNADRAADIVAIDPDNERVEVFLSQGDGSFALAGMPEVDFTPSAVAVADVASPFASEAQGRPDGKPDIIVGGDSGELAVLLGRNDGQFDPPEQDFLSLDGFDTSGIISIVPGSFDAVTGTDVALLDEDGVFMLCNDNNGSMFVCGGVDGDPIELGDGTDLIVKMVAGNFDGDAHLDLAALDQDTNTVYALFGNGDGTFSDPGEGFVATAEGMQSRDLAVGRLDSDAIDDLAIVTFDENLQNLGLVLFGTTNRRFSRTSPFVADFTASSIALADFDGSSTVDAVVGYENGLFSVNIGDGAGTLQDPFIPVGARTGDVSVIQAADVTDDSLADVVTLNPDGTELQVAVNISNEPTPTPRPTVTATVPPTLTPTATSTRRRADNDDGCGIGTGPGRPAMPLLSGFGVLLLLAAHRRRAPGC